MTNHISYPFHSFYKGYCVICFENGIYGFSSCCLSESNKIYLLNSDYLDNAFRIDYKDKSGEIYHMTHDEFLQFLKSGELKPEFSESAMLLDNGEIRKCPLCGKPLSVKVAGKGDKAGHLFYGCSGYPRCRFTENI